MTAISVTCRGRPVTRIRPKAGLIVAEVVQKEFNIEIEFPVGGSMKLHIDGKDQVFSGLTPGTKIAFSVTQIEGVKLLPGEPP